MITIDDLRRDWQREIEAYDDAIALLEKEKLMGAENDGLGKPARVWVGMLHTWRNQIKELLAQYPGKN
jgi:hypothetical protein